MSPSLPTPTFFYILNIFLSPTLRKFLFFHNCHATPKGHGLPPPQNSERAPVTSYLSGIEVKNLQNGDVHIAQIPDLEVEYLENHLAH